MSQLLVIKKTQMIEKEYLTQALEDLGHAWRAGPTRLGLFGPRVEIKTQVHGRTIGFRKAGQNYEMVIVGEREWSTSRAQFLQQVSQRYAYHAARAKLEEQGFTLASEEVREDGRIHLVLRRMA